MSSAPTGTPSWRSQLILGVGALGVVFGDIGTSPLYALRECLAVIPHTEDSAGVLGAVSLVFWALVMVVSVKYLMFITRADNRGEGGIFALMALSMRPADKKRTSIGLFTMVLLCGAALIYGESVITPAISVLSAAEGFKSIHPGFGPYIITISVVILAGLFLLQQKGTKTIGGLFGPVMLVWFGALGAIGILQIWQAPEILAALNPKWGFTLLLQYPAKATALLGSVVLAVTGVEALFADMGHFGRSYIKWAWNLVALPGLVLNYLGQGAFAIRNPGTTENIFFATVPDGPIRVSLVILSILAAIIASQALITGTYSLTRQAIQLGYFPRLKILHTNAAFEGQIYLPLVNACLAIGSIWVVLAFKSSQNLAAAYGVAVTGAMLVTTIAFHRVLIIRWRWPVWGATMLCGLFGSIDAAFLYANLHKFVDGGWLPLAIGTGIILVMYTWKCGRGEILEKVYSGAVNDLQLSEIARSKSIVRVQGSAVFMVASPKGVPLALLHHLKANKCLHETVVLMTIQTEDIPHVPENERLSVSAEGEGVWRAIGRYGYMESPDVSDLCERIREIGVRIKTQETTFFFNREMIFTGGNARMWEWQKRLYAFLSRNAHPVKDYYKIMPTQVIEIGLPIQL